MKSFSSFTEIADRELLAEVQRLAAAERHATAELIASLAEVDARRLYLGEGCSSLFTYCTQVLHLSEHAAYLRIEAARAARKFPLILEALARGEVTLTAVGLLAAHLTGENHREVLTAARHKSKRDVEQIVAALHPRPDVRATIRKLPVLQPPTIVSAQVVNAATVAPGTARKQASTAPLGPSDGSLSSLNPAAVAIETGKSTETALYAPQPAPSRVAAVQALAPQRFKIQFTVGRETYDKLRRAQDLLRHAIPDGDPAAVFERALTLLVAHLEKQKVAMVMKPRVNRSGRSTTSGSRTIPAETRRTVWRRDGGRCAFVGPHGRCTETGRLEFHHVVPYAHGGPATADNIQLRCRAHNQHEADGWFGPMCVRERIVGFPAHGEAGG